MATDASNEGEIIMAKHLYLGILSDGFLLSRTSSNPSFTHAAIATGDRGKSLPSFSSKGAHAAILACSPWSEIESAPVFKVTKEVYRDALKAAKDNGGYLSDADAETLWIIRS